MTSTDVMKALRERWIWVLSGLIAGSLFATALFLIKAPEYTATSTLYVSARTDSSTTSAYQGNLLSQQRVVSYTELATSERVAIEVKNALRSPASTSEISDSLSASNRTDSVIIDLSATAKSGQDAVELNNAATQSFIKLVDQLETPAVPGLPSPVSVRIVQPAVVPGTPSSTGLPATLASGSIAGLLIGLALAVARYKTDTTLRTVSALSAAAGLPNLAVIASEREEAEGYLPVLRAPRGPNAESFRQLRTNLRYVSVDKPPQTILVTGSLPGEGKSTVATNLALAIASTEERVLLIEADLRRPKMASTLNLTSDVGLTSVLSGRANVRAALQRAPLVENLDVLASGLIPPNPSELLGSQRMHDLLEELKQAYDLIIVDTPPLLSVTDAAALSSYVDGVILVCQARRTSTHELQSSLDALQKVSAKILGTVLTRASATSVDVYARYTSYYTRPESESSDRGAHEGPAAPSGRFSNSNTDLLATNGRSPDKKPVPYRRSANGS